MPVFFSESLMRKGFTTSAIELAPELRARKWLGFRLPNGATRSHGLRSPGSRNRPPESRPPGEKTKASEGRLRTLIKGPAAQFDHGDALCDGDFQDMFDELSPHTGPLLVGADGDGVDFEVPAFVAKRVFDPLLPRDRYITDSLPSSSASQTCTFSCPSMLSN